MNYSEAGPYNPQAASQSNYSNQSIGSISGAAALTRPPRLDQVADRFEKSLSEFQTLTQRLGNVADRVLGPIPEAVENNKQPPSPSATVGKLDAMLEGLQHLLRRLQQSTERLETL